MLSKKKKKVSERRSRHKRSASKPTTPVNLLRGAIGDRKNWGVIRSALDGVKNDGSPSEFERLFRVSLTNNLTAIALAASKHVKKNNQIQAVTPLDSDGIHREIAWVVTVLSFNEKLINRFAELRSEYCVAVCNGLYDEAEKILATIDDDCGLSLWSIENRIALLTLAGGFERQKNYVSSLIEADRRSFVSFFASNIGERNEARVSIHSFEARLRERSKTWKIKSDQATYIFFKLVGVPPRSAIEAVDILSFEAASSPIDLYETFLEVMASAQSAFNIDSHKVAVQLRKLDAIDDQCLSNIISIYTQELPNEIECPGYLDEFLAGNFEKAATQVESRLSKNPDDPLMLLVAAKIKAMGVGLEANDNRFYQHLLTLLSAFLEQGKASDEAVQSLERFALNLRTLPISSTISNLISEASTDLFGAITVTTAVKARTLSLPVCLTLINQKASEELLKSAPNNDATWNYEKLAYLGQAATKHGLSAESVSYAGISFSKRTNRPSQAFQYLDVLSQSSNSYYQQEASILRAWFLTEDGDIPSAILHTIRSALHKPTLLRSLPLVQLISPRGFRDLKQMEGELCLSIAFFLYASITRESTKDVALKVAWKQFHKVHGLAKPSELKSKFAQFERTEALFFLRHVCTQEIMELSSAFNSPSDLDRERLQICIALSELDPDRSDDYEKEILELTRRLSIEDGVQQVESTRVYVDILGLQRWFHQNINDLFLRYMDYLGAGFEASQEELERSLIVIVKKSGSETAFLSFLDAYDISADSLLAELLEECASRFLTLPRFGLDAFLGSRVRHGSLEGAFRSPLEARKLITKIDSSTNQYDSNTYWLNSVEAMPKEQRAALDKALNTFSANVDGLIDLAITKHVHVKSVNYPEGLIGLWPADEKKRSQILKAWLLNTKASMTKEATIEQFVEFCATELCWPNLKASLSNAADYVTTVLAGEIKQELIKLEAAGRRNLTNHSGLSACIDAALSDIDNAASKVSRWFAPPQFTNADATYLLKTGIEIGLTSLRHTRPEFDNDVTWEIDDRANVLLNTAGFQTINDVAFLIFGNILKHSGFFDTYSVVSDGRAKIHIWLRWNDPDVIEVEVQNEISRTKCIASIEDNVRSAKDQIRRGQFDSVVRQKTKTGLVRLASVLNYENSADKTVDFGVTNGSRFHVKFSVPAILLTGQRV